MEGALYLLAPVACALAIAHDRGIVHRDIKPGNVCLLADASVRAAGPTKLLDFGIALTAEETAAAGGLSAVHSFTPVYGAPEQFDVRFGRIGPWTDVFALALVFVELVAGREALEGSNIMRLAKSACNATRRPTPRRLGVAVSDEIEAVLARALAVRPNDRHPNAAQFWSALTRSVAIAKDDLRATLPIPLVQRRALHEALTPMMFGT